MTMMEKLNSLEERHAELRKEVVELVGAVQELRTTIEEKQTTRQQPSITSVPNWYVGDVGPYGERNK